MPNYCSQGIGSSVHFENMHQDPSSCCIRSQERMRSNKVFTRNQNTLLCRRMWRSYKISCWYEDYHRWTQWTSFTTYNKRKQKSLMNDKINRSIKYWIKTFLLQRKHLTSMDMKWFPLLCWSITFSMVSLCSAD